EDGDAREHDPSEQAARCSAARNGPCYGRKRLGHRRVAKDVIDKNLQRPRLKKAEQAARQSDQEDEQPTSATAQGIAQQQPEDIAPTGAPSRREVKRLLHAQTSRSWIVAAAPNAAVPSAA